MLKQVLVILTMLVSLQACAKPTYQLEQFRLVPMQVAEQQIQVQLADTPQKRSQGLMFKQSADPGMLLLYPEPRVISLWMANTSMPLDVAYIDANWTITELIELEPFDETSRPAKSLVIAALEMPRGWFAKHGVVVGQKVALPQHQN